MAQQILNLIRKNHIFEVTKQLQMKSYALFQEYIWLVNIPRNGSR